MRKYDDIEMALLNDFQHDFPLTQRPFRALGEQLGISEDAVLRHLAHLSEEGVISRVGPVFSPGSIGASTLAALAASPTKLESLAQWLNGLPEINHNYQREHRYNLWFVATAPDAARLNGTLENIAEHAACSMLTLPLLESFHIDLGFDLAGKPRRHRAQSGGARVQLSAAQSAIVAALQSGIPLQAEPFAAIAQRLNITPDEVLAQIAHWHGQGVVKRFGVVVRHHELGYRENAMAVWDVPDEAASAIGKIAARQTGVTLCYRRARQMPDWPYNLYCMVHGTARATVQAQVAALARESGLADFPARVLFSNRRFKQYGARYVFEEHHGRN
ncbi:MAG: Lrp/AsnC family transcriptional regulator [Methylobacillus sp.]|jgi:DNA-binding Lrp family transcriptional regulator|nr:Lrp/AsnC family transcriptional regulator [Methylobacillus sp.]